MHETSEECIAVINSILIHNNTLITWKIRYSNRLKQGQILESLLK